MPHIISVPVVPTPSPVPKNGNSFFRRRLRLLKWVTSFEKYTLLLQKVILSIVQTKKHSPSKKSILFLKNRKIRHCYKKPVTFYQHNSLFRRYVRFENPSILVLIPRMSINWNCGRRIWADIQKLNHETCRAALSRRICYPLTSD